MLRCGQSVLSKTQRKPEAGGRTAPGRQPFAGALSKDEIRHLRRLSRGSADPREYSRSWRLAQICVTSGCLPGAVRPPASSVLNKTNQTYLLISLHTSVKTPHAPDYPLPIPDETPVPSASHTEPPQPGPLPRPALQPHPKPPPHKAPG